MDTTEAPEEQRDSAGLRDVLLSMGENMEVASLRLFSTSLLILASIVEGLSAPNSDHARRAHRAGNVLAAMNTRDQMNSEDSLDAIEDLCLVAREIGVQIWQDRPVPPSETLEYNLD